MTQRLSPTAASDGKNGARAADSLLERHVRFLEANLSSIPDYVYAFDRQRRFAYANPAMLALFGRSADQMLGKSFADLDYPPDLARLLNGQLDRIFAEGMTVENEVFFRSPTGHAAYFAYLWGPFRDEDGSVELVVGVSRDTSEARASEDMPRTSETRLRAAIDVAAQRRAEAAIRASEAQFRSFAAHSSNLIWIGDPATGTIVYRSAAYERIWGVPCHEAASDFADWINDVHPDDRRQVDHALAAVTAGEAVQFEYRIVRPRDGAIRSLRDTSFPILDDDGAVTRIGGITEDLTQEDIRHVYIVAGRVAAARKLSALVRALGCRARVFESGSAFLDIAPVLAPGCVLLDLRRGRYEGLAILRELRARSIALPAIALDAAGAEVACAVVAMKAGAVDYIAAGDEASLRATLAVAIGECQRAARGNARDENAGARLARLTTREREVLIGLVDGGTNKIIGQKLGISPRTVELHRAQVMNRLNANSLTELLQVALAAGIMPSSGEGGEQRPAI